MKNYKVYFWGRTKGAIGKFYWITTEVEAPEGGDLSQIRIRLYDRYEDVMLLTVLSDEKGVDHE